MRRTIAVTVAVIAATLVILVLTLECVIISLLTPERPFTAAGAPPAPDYESPSSWAALPGMANESDLVPDDAAEGRSDTPPADLFYIYPTGHFGSDNWNAALDPGGRAWEHARVMLATQASAWNGVCRIFAPRYREATIVSFVLKHGEGFAALELAYGDVSRAFDHYLARYNGGRPLIIAGHSQGALYALRLLQEKVDRTPVARRLVAAYLAGCQVPLKTLRDSFSIIGVCGDERDTGCIVSWNTVRAEPKHRARGITWRSGSWQTFDGEDTLCTNPLTWRSDEGPAGPERHRGAIELRYPGDAWSMITGRAGGYHPTELGPLRRGSIESRCRDGFLIAESRDGLPGWAFINSLHPHDYTIFYGNVRENAHTRVRAFISFRSAPVVRFRLAD